MAIEMALDVGELSERVSVAAQLAPEDFATIAAAGFRSLINNRPDDEEPGQPRNAELAASAARHGLAYHFLPILSGRYEDADIAALGEALTWLPAPTMLFCRTGNRSACLWALHAACNEDAQKLLVTAFVAGFDLTELMPRMQLARRA